MIPQISNLQEKIVVTPEMEETIVKVVNEVERFEGVGAEVEVSFALVDDEYIRELNRTYRGKDCSTDVLSFAFRDSDDEDTGIDVSEEAFEQEEMLGDIIISLETAKRQADEFGHGFQRELAFLTVHGLLHLLGYDHLTEAEEKDMLIRQEEILHNLNFTRD